ncbi:MAG: acyltransferase, partial [Acinetobacter sp.]|nr:acyltransferase [Acinetobacter sp.]
MKKFLGNSIFKAVGWTYNVDPQILEKKQVIIGFEHTSNLDAVLSIALFQMLDIK